MSAVPAASTDGYVGPGRPPASEFDRPQIAAVSPVLAGTMLRYLDQIALSLRPASVTAASHILRMFAGYLTAAFPTVNGLVDVERNHLEGFKRYLPTRPGRKGGGLSPMAIRIQLGTLRTFFERVSEWGYPDAPTRVLIFNGDLPTPDDPLPKFLSDPDAAKLMRAAADAGPVRRLVVEMLALTGLRVAEFCELEADAVVFMNGRHWLRVPIGKLHNDRHVPLHHQLLAQLDEHGRDSGSPITGSHILEVVQPLTCHPASGRTPAVIVASYERDSSTSTMSLPGRARNRHHQAPESPTSTRPRCQRPTP